MNNPYNTEEDLKWEQIQILLHDAYTQAVKLNVEEVVTKVNEINLFLQSAVNNLSKKED